MTALTQTLGESHHVRPKFALSTHSVATLVLLAATIIIRAPWFGDITYHEDESFYLAFAQAMHRGAIPYVDIWDRKPFGLFIIYWLITFLPGSGFMAYQTVAGLFCWATSFVVHRIVQPLHGASAGVAAGIVYLACGPVLLGAGGQSPIFYNLFIALAVLLVLQAPQDCTARALIGRYALAMLLCGCAITVKPPAIVEAVFLGVVAAYRISRRPDMRLPLRLLTIILMAVIGALPTLAIFVGFAMIGAFPIYWFASVISVGLKAPQATDLTLSAIRYLILLLFPLWIMVVIGAGQMARSRDNVQERHLLLGWMAAAFGGFVLIPNFWDHYALPLMAPLAVMASPVFARRNTGLFWAGVVLIWAMFVTGWPTSSRATIANRQIHEIVHVIDQNRRGGCIYLFEGAPAIYALTPACHVTSRVFPQHLSFLLERPAIGLDPTKEVGRILRRQPEVVVMAAKPLVLPYNAASRKLLLAGLHDRYRKIASMPISETNRATYHLDIWVLRHDPAPAERRPL